jgi:5-methylcytosine-specific restriction endonuclease McrA
MNPHYPEVSHRAAHRCEYCHVPEVIFNFPFEVEHVIPISHQGADEPSNLALACRSGNIHKASHLTGFEQSDDSPQTGSQLRNVMAFGYPC